MKLRTKLFLHTDAAGNENNLEDQDVIIMLNGQKTETKLHEIFSDLEFDDGEIYGNSLLSYYEPQEDGSLHVPGSIIQLFNDTNNELVLIKKIKRPTLNDDTVIPFEHVQKFAEFFKVEKPDEVFFDLNDEEKQTFIQARLDAETSATATAAATATSSAAEALRKEKELKASIDPKFVHHKKDYLSYQGFYRGIDFKEYIDGAVHLFYAKNDDETPFILIKRGADWWEEPTDTQLADETGKTLVVEFSDGEVLKQITLDITKGETTLTDAVASE